MTKPDFDKYFVSKIPKMRLIITKLINKYKKYHLDLDAVISETYIYILPFIDIFETNNQCERYMFNFINKNILWLNSQLNRKEGLNNITEGYDPPEVIDDIEENIRTKVELETWYNKRQALLILYRNQLLDKEKIIIYDCFFVKKLQTGKALGKHLGLNTDYALAYIRQMKLDIIQFEIEEFIRNNKL